mmetsp:Transcript_58587/g.191070  ORF Transcript_58587/g.191070 Transcript_58587/m.191070 type:complete len:843 (+) Transcript_58587:71-2599(+)
MSMCRLLLVAAVLCTLQETEADAEVGENPTGLVPPSESPELNTGLSLHFQATTEVVWAIFNVALGYWILSRLESRQHNGVDMAFAWFLVPVHFAEGIAFLMSALNLFKQSPLISTAFLVLQISCHTPFLWARVYYLLRHDEPKEGMLVACKIFPFTTLVAVLVVMFPKSPLAAVAFELPGVLSIVAVFALVVASGRPNCTCPDLQGNAWIMAGVTVAFWLVHLWHMTWKFGGTPTTPMLEIIRLVLAMSLFAAGASLSITISELGTFQRIDDFSGSAWTRADLPTKVLSNRFAVSPDRMFSAAFVFSALAYVITGFCLVKYSTFSIDSDPIVKMYNAFHPCILLDYLPGTLFAQPLFDLQIIVVNISMQAAFIRKILEGGYMRIIVGAIAYVLFIICSTFFQLVFTFNPTHVSVMLHSIPFMVFHFGIGVFMYSEAFSCYMSQQGGALSFAFKSFRNFIFMSYIGLCLWVVLKVEFMMTRSMMTHSDIALNLVGTSVPLKPLDWGWQQYMTTFVAWLQEPLYFLWFWVSPRSSKALNFNVTIVRPDRGLLMTVENEDEEDGDDLGNAGDNARYMFAQDTQRPSNIVGSVQPQKSAMQGEMTTTEQPDNLKFSIKIGMLLRVGMALAMLVVYTAQFVHQASYGEHVDRGQTWILSMRSLPAGPIIAVGWVFVAMWLSMYAIIFWYKEQCMNPSCVMRMLVSVSVAGLLIGVLAMHGGTIPEVPLWYKGPEFFAISVSFFILVKVALTIQDWHELRPASIALELSAALVVFGLTINTVIKRDDRTFTTDTLVCVSHVVWSFCDADPMLITFSGFTLEPATHGLWPAFWKTSGPRGAQDTRAQWS